MSSRAAVLRPARRAAHPGMNQVVEVALVLAISVSAIGILAALEPAPAGRTKSAVTQARVDAVSLPWRTDKESQSSLGTPEVRLSEIRHRASVASLTWRALKEGQTPAAALDLPTRFQAPGPNAGPLGWRSHKEMTSHLMPGGR